MKYLKYVLIIWSLGLTCCATYNKTPVSFEDAIGHGKVKVITAEGNTAYLTNIYRANEQYFGTLGGNEINLDTGSAVRIYLSNPPQNSFMLGFMGSGSIFDISYEHHHKIAKKVYLSERLGFGFNEEFQLCLWGTCSEPESYLTIPHHLTLNIGDGRTFIELGLGGTYLHSKSNNEYFIYPLIGFRLHAGRKNNLSFRIFANGTSRAFNETDAVFSPIGLTLGTRF